MGLTCVGLTHLDLTNDSNLPNVFNSLLTGDACLGKSPIDEKKLGKCKATSIFRAAPRKSSDSLAECMRQLLNSWIEQDAASESQEEMAIFDGRPEEKVELGMYINRLMKLAHISEEYFVIAMVYMQNFRKSAPFKVTSLNVNRY